MIKKIFEKSCPFIGKSLNFSIFLRIQLHFFEDSFHEMKDLISNVYNFLFVCRPKPFIWLFKILRTRLYRGAHIQLLIPYLKRLTLCWV